MARCWIVALLLILSTAPLASAQETPPTDPPMTPADRVARAHFETGRAYYAQGNYTDAAREFERAYASSPRPEFLYNLYTAHERLGHLAEAVDHLDRYLAVLPTEAPERPDLEARLARLRSRVEDEQRATQEARAREEEAIRSANRRADDLDRERRREREEDREAAATRRTVALVTSFGIGGLGLATFGVFAVLAAIEDGQVSEECGSSAGGFCTEEQTATLGTYTLVADIGLAVGAAGALTGLVLLIVTGGSEDEAQASVGVRPIVGPVVGLTLEGRLP